MKPKQLQALQRQYCEFVDRNDNPKPCLNHHISLALVNQEPVKVKPAATIIAMCRNKIAESRYNRDFGIHELFESCASFDRALKEWEKRESDRAKRVQAFLKLADPLMRKAELNSDADPEEIAAALIEAARSCGLLVAGQGGEGAV